MKIKVIGHLPPWEGSTVDTGVTVCVGWMSKLPMRGEHKMLSLLGKLFLHRLCTLIIYSHFSYLFFYFFEVGSHHVVQDGLEPGHK